jgi:hypothetical protein
MHPVRMSRRGGIGQILQETWLKPDERVRLGRLQSAFWLLFAAGTVCLASGSFSLPVGWSDPTAFVFPGILLVGGVVLLTLAFVVYSRLRTYSAVLTESRRAQLAGSASSQPTLQPAKLGNESGGSTGLEVDLAPFWQDTATQSRLARPRVLPLVAAFAVITAILLVLAAEAAVRRDLESALEFGSLGAVCGAIVGLWAVILYAPDLPSRPHRLRIDGAGLQLTRTRGPPVSVSWEGLGPRLFIMDTRPSVRRRTSPNESVLALYAEGLGFVPLTPEGAAEVIRLARQSGFDVELRPQGDWRQLPLGPRMSLPFGSQVTVMSRR